MKQRLHALALLGLFCLFATPGLGAQAAEGPKVESAAEKGKKRSDTIRYGIESEILELIKTLGSEKDSSHNQELLDLLISSRSSKLRSAILDFFRSLSWPDAEDEALRLVEDRDLEDDALVASALAYLAEIRSAKALDFASAIIEEDNKKILPSLVRLLGRAGGTKEEDLLLAWLEGDAPTESLRQEAIRALGEIGSKKAAESLMKIAENGEAPRFNRIYACEALAKIKYPASVSSLVKAANGEDPNVRSAAVEALGAFADKEAQSALREALRDGFVKSRVAACKAIAAQGLVSAVPALIYKAENDPERAVKIEAMRSLAELGGEESLGYLRAYLDDKKHEMALRVTVFGLLARKDAAGSMDLLAQKLLAESKEKDRSYFTALAREIANAEDAKAAAPLARILLADSDYLIRLGGLEWARRTKSPDIAADIASIAEKDPSDAVRKRASEILSLF